MIKVQAAPDGKKGGREGRERSMRLLLAEDEAALSKALKAILERNNYSVDVVGDGQAALEYLESDNYDGAILDIMMPKADGITVLRELLARIRAMTRTQAAQASSRLQVGNVTLDRAAFELSTPSGSYRLANREFQMMEMLMSNPKTLISSERFMEKIWGYDSEAEINVVWVYLSYLRKKLAALHANIRIRAVRSAGYTLEEIA